MNHLDIFNFLKARLAPVQIPGRSLAAASADEEPQIHVDPITCHTFEELKKHFFSPPPEDKSLSVEYTWDIECTLATMLATVLSTDTTGGQLGLRVKGVPGSFKSVSAECISCCRELVYPRSKFTGFISGWQNIRRSQITAEKANGKCVLVKDADAMLQLPNLSMVESEIRDAMGDGVIRADYRTGREFEIYTHFSMILCGTLALQELDNVQLGARFIDIFIQRPGADVKKIVRRAIQSQSQQICSQTSGRRGKEDSNTLPDRVKAIVRKLGAPTYGFLLHKKEQLRKGLEIIPLTSLQEDRVQAMGELMASMRAKVKREFGSKELKHRPEPENATRLGEQITRMVHYLSVVFQEGDEPAVASEREFRIADKILRDTLYGYELDILNYLVAEPRGASSLDVSGACDIGTTKAYELCQNLRDLGIVSVVKVPNIHGKGQRLQLYRLSDEIQQLIERSEFKYEPKKGFAKVE